METASTPARAPRSFDRCCAVHTYWPLKENGACARCEDAADRRARGLEVFTPVPPVGEWPRAVKAEVFRRYLQHVVATYGSEPQREQQAWERILVAVACATSLVDRRLAVSPAEVWHRLQQQSPQLFGLPATPPAPTPTQAPATPAE